MRSQKIQKEAVHVKQEEVNRLNELLKEENDKKQRNQRGLNKSKKEELDRLMTKVVQSKAADTLSGQTELLARLNKMLNIGAQEFADIRTNLVNNDQQFDAIKYCAEYHAVAIE